MAELDGSSETGGEPLSSVARWACGLTGLLAATAGAVAVFATENGAGTTALIAAGVVLAVVAVNGIPIRSMKVGASEVMFASLAQRASVARSQGDNEEAQHLWQESFHLARARFGLQADPDEYSATTTSVINSLSDRWTVHTTPSGRSPVPIVDAIIETAEVRLGLAVRAGPAFKPNSVVTSLERAMRDSGLHLRGFLVVVNCDQSEDKLDYFRQLSEIRGVPAVPVGWKIGDKLSRLQDALEELLRAVAGRGGDTAVEASVRAQRPRNSATGEATTVRLGSPATTQTAESKVREDRSPTKKRARNPRQPKPAPGGQSTE